MALNEGTFSEYEDYTLWYYQDASYAANAMGRSRSMCEAREKEFYRWWTEDEDMRLNFYFDKKIPWRNIAHCLQSNPHSQAVTALQCQLRIGKLRGQGRWSGSPFSEAEDQHLRLLNQVNPFEWLLIAVKMTCRTPGECYDRLLALDVGNWTQREDEQLKLAFFDRSGGWNYLVGRIPGKTVEMVKKRVKDLRLSLYGYDWKNEEDLEVMGMRYWTHEDAAMERLLPGRSIEECRRRIQHLSQVSEQ
ncbi:hypothetical protein ACLMJK_003871 [Lecanora helva]